MDGTDQAARDEYEAWMAAALGAMERRATATLRPLLTPQAAAGLAPQERAAAALAQVVAALAAEARIEAVFDAATSVPVRRGSFADYGRQFPEAEA